MKYRYAVTVILLGLASPAFAQLNPNGSGGPSNLSNQNQLQPKGAAPDIAPPALPGAAAPVLATGPNLRKASTGDPTTALFAAVNNADYNAAQDAVSRGADVNAQNNLGETPLDLSIALNHNDITFMLLSARNEGGGDTTPQGSATAAAVHTAPVNRAMARRPRATPAKMVAPAHASAPVYDSGTPNPAAGFLGFGANK